MDVHLPVPALLLDTRYLGKDRGSEEKIEQKDHTSKYQVYWKRKLSKRFSKMGRKRKNGGKREENRGKIRQKKRV